MATLHRVDLPGLVGDEPLGFLAAIGLMGQLLENSYLHWDPRDRHAVLHCHSYSSVADLVAMLCRRLDEIKPGQAIPFSAGFPVRRRRGAPDPLRVRPAEYRKLLDRVGRSPGGASWLQATVTDRATDTDGFCLVNPLVAVRSKQTIGSFWYYPMLDVRRDPKRLITEALTGWRRVEGSEGWLLDHQATYSTDPGLRGPGGSMAVPGATWLATLAISEFGYRRRNGIDSGPVLPSGWFRAGNRDVFLWPLWTVPAGSNTLKAVWNVGWGYDGWEITSAGDGQLEVRISKTHGVPAPNSIDHNVDLGIFTMCAAARPPGAALTPVPIRTLHKPTGNPDRKYPAWKGWDWKYSDVGEYPGKYGWG
ncbi:type I-G CRISPR-associated protein, Cas3-extension family [Micromonospora sp. URMC 107]|uniref:type I-G CRISPR-associated protein, Cas3-extension family n=1 Tax=Micromonospora sp. URMC 107 TaxID=3423418 RepID=UPI003F1BBFA6